MAIYHTAHTLNTIEKPDPLAYPIYYQNHKMPYYHSENTPPPPSLIYSSGRQDNLLNWLFVFFFRAKGLPCSYVHVVYAKSPFQRVSNKSTGREVVRKGRQNNKDLKSKLKFDV